MLTRIHVGVARDQHQHDDRRQVGQHRQHLARHLHALALQMELQHRDAAEEIGAEQHAHRPPGGEGGQRERDPALARDHALDPQRRVDDRDVGAGDAAQRAADDDRGEPDAPHRVAERMRRLGRLAHRAQHQPGARAVEEPGQRRGQRDREVDHRMLAEQRRADERDVGEPGDRRSAAAPPAFPACSLMPTKAEKPAPNRLSARPVAYWLVLSQITSTPKAAASTRRRSAPAPKASQSLPVCTAVAKPAMAATSIMPSAPRLTMPARSLMSRPSPARASTVPAFRVAASEECEACPSQAPCLSRGVAATRRPAVAARAPHPRSLCREARWLAPSPRRGWRSGTARFQRTR